MLIRPARSGDEDGIACLHVHSWQSTYRGIMPDQVLRTFTLEDRRQMWDDAMRDIQENSGKKMVFVAIEDGKIIGFVCGGVARKDQLKNQDEFDSEIYTIYVEGTAQGKGLGAKLFLTMKQWLVEHHFKNMFLWAFADNPFLHFYPKMGGVQGTEEHINQSLGVPLKIVNFAWYDMDKDQ